ncbi:uncharacterized protein DNG_07543 [Cephalotrichum gorgonifer]|uniref:Heterokaryon incompatibility domain-containing protein n=1 Tax=Cephalotrichum gorgonifer TaxID=2041049 RepID=A0AAE8SXJ5_9PEZI|nr:uncharacterized protein DNG_07543 [Cephalotrichum gorgonifer]
MAQRLCSACEGITLRALCQDGGYQHLPNSREIFESARTCDLCDLIRHAMHQNISYAAGTRAQREQKILADIPPEPMFLLGSASPPPLDHQSGPASPDGPFNLIGIDVHMPAMGGQDIVQLSLVASPGSEARRDGHVIGRPLLQDASSAEALDLLRGWFRSCISGHPACRLSFFAPEVHRLTDAPPLPTRVVDVGSSDGLQEPQLKLTGGACALYATLSHCWGKHQIITTTTANLHQHCKVIRFSELSKTFQDAVVITRALGLRYLWIDSLCIIQDDKQDWKEESAKMGRIYQNAAITIAASWAKDGREGCFQPRSFSSPRVALPYSVDGEAIPGEFMHATLFPDAAVSDLDGSPLGQRAWITQEWMLSPRTVHYTRARFVWACRTVLEGEDGEVIPQMNEQRLLESVRRFRDHKNKPSEERGPAELDDMAEFFADWCDVVCTYTSRQLTYESDRPIAILGLADEIRQGIRAEYTAGVFYEGDQHRPATTPLDGRDESSDPPSVGPPRSFADIADRCMILQLLWFSKIDLVRPAALCHFPSWSWTSTMGEVAYHIPARTGKPVASRIRICDVPTSYPQLGSDVSLVLHAPIKPLDLGKYRVAYTDTLIDWPMETPFYEFHSRTTFADGAAIISRKAVYIAHADERPVGCLSIDTGTLPPDTDLFCVCFSVNEVGGAFDGFNVMIVAERRDADKEPERQFVRLGVGEIVEEGWFDDASSSRILLK